jgi:hypothetical protein
VSDETDFLRAAFQGVKIKFWTCPDCQDEFIEWCGDIATCQSCGTIIFSHDFAKAFWGEGKIKINGNILKSKFDQIEIRENGEVFADNDIPAWQYHLQKLAISKDRLKYLEEFLDEKEIFN